MGTGYIPKTHIMEKVSTSTNRGPMMRTDSSKRLTVFSEAEKCALYGLPDFDDFQRAEFFAMTEAERALVDRRNGLPERLHCLLQIGYFKAKQAFFNFSNLSS